MKVGYETYRYFKRKEAPRKIEPYELNIIKYFALLAGFESYPENCESYEFDDCIHFSKNLIDEIA